MDAPAKSFVLGTKGHNAYGSCTKYTAEGEYINGRMCFLDLHCPMRTDSGFRTKIDEDYHQNETPLLSLENDLVKIVPLDYMHLVCLGVMKKLLKMWISGNQSVAITKTDFLLLDRQLMNIKNSISYKDFARTPRTLKELENWKASEYRQFLLYTGPIILKNCLKKSKYVHFLALHCSVRILCTSDLYLKYNSFKKRCYTLWKRTCESQCSQSHSFT